MRITLTHKYVGSLFAALITCCGVVLFVSIYFMKVPIEVELDTGIRRMQNVITELMDTISTDGIPIIRICSRYRPVAAEIAPTARPPIA